MTLVGRHALVTGGGRGIGRAIAGAFMAAGAHVTVAGRNRVTLEGVVAEGFAHGLSVLDVTDEASVRSAVAQLVPVDIFVANAGAGESAPFLKTDAAMFRRMMDINLMGVVHGIHAVLPGMLERKSGRIIVTASTASLKGYAYVSAYTASKHAVLGLVRALALETVKHGVTVNAVCPGYADTEMTDGTIDIISRKTGRSPEAAMADLLRDNPLGRLIAPEEVAAACVYLAGDAAASVTGIALPVAGGEV